MTLARAPSVLLVVRHERDRERLRAAIEAEGALVQTADDARDAGAVLDAWPCDVLVCALPPWDDETDERRACGALAAARSIPAIAVGGDAPLAGFAQVLVAPVAPSEVAEAAIAIASLHPLPLPAVATSEAQAQAPTTIVLVDDDDEIREALGELLEDEGYVVERAEDGWTALCAIERLAGAPCLVLLDLMMPTMDGWEFLRALEASGRKIPVIAVSAVGGVAPPGTELLIAKPASGETIVGAVRATLASTYA